MLTRILLALAFSTVCLAQCSQEIARGTWAIYYQGTNMTAGSSGPVATPVAQLTVAKVDYGGNFSGTGYVSIGGQVKSVTLSGNIQVNADCTASDTYTMNVAGTGLLSGTGTERLLILNNGAEMRAMTTRGLLGSPAGTVYYRRMSWWDAECSQDMVHGAYGTSFDGVFVMTPPGQSQAVAYPYSQLGVGAYDYAGKGGGRATMSLGGNVVPAVISDATLTVNADCSGTLKYPSGTLQLVVLNYGDEMLAIGAQITGGSPIFIGKYTRISTTPVMPNW